MQRGYGIPQVYSSQLYTWQANHNPGCHLTQMRQHHPTNYIQNLGADDEQNRYQSMGINYFHGGIINYMKQDFGQASTNHSKVMTICNNYFTSQQNYQFNRFPNTFPTINHKIIPAEDFDSRCIWNKIDKKKFYNFDIGPTDFQNQHIFYQNHSGLQQHIENQLQTDLCPDLVYFDQQNSRKQSDVEMLINQISKINDDMKLLLSRQENGFYNQNYSQNDELYHKIASIDSVLWSSYKLYQLNQLNQIDQQTQRIKNKTSSVLQFHFKNNHQQQEHVNKLNRVQLIDYKNEFQTLIKLKDYYSCENASNQTNKMSFFEVQTHVNEKNYGQDAIKRQEQIIKKYSQYSCLDLFVRIVLVMRQFYSLKDKIKSYFNVNDKINQPQQIFSQTNKESLLKDQADQPPGLITNILWHIQSARVLISTYEYQLKHLLSKSNNQTLHTSKRILQYIKEQFIEVFKALEQLMMKFLQSLMLFSGQQDKYNDSNSSPQGEDLGFFYYQHAAFNWKWIYLLLDTILIYQMALQTDTLQCLHQNIRQLNCSSQETSQSYHKKNINSRNIQNHLQNKKNHHKKTSTQNLNSHKLDTQIVNNILNILSFLLSPRTNNHSNSQMNRMINLLEIPIKKIIVNQIKNYKKKLSQAEQGYPIHKFIIEKYVLIDKITNIVSFFITKITHFKNTTHQSRKNQLSHQKQTNNTKNFKNQQSNNQAQNDNLSMRQLLQFKVMEITLFVRQMADILLFDNVKKEQKGMTSSIKNDYFSRISQWIESLSVESILGKLFQKVKKKKKLTI